MGMVFFYITLAGLLMCATSVVAAGILLLKESVLKKILFPVVSISSGVLIGSAFLFLVPESIELLKEPHFAMLIVLLGFLTFLFLEELLKWHHCHKTPNEHSHEHERTKDNKLGWLITFSDFFHNAIDGASIAATFIISPELGLLTTLSTFLHELPQEIGDVGILIHSGIKKKRAFLMNLVSQLSFFIGAYFIFFYNKAYGGNSNSMLINFLIPFTAGTFIYISAVDLVPEIKASHITKERLHHTLYFLLGIFFVYLMMNFVGHSH